MSAAGSELLRLLEEAAPGAVRADVDLGTISRWRIGGTATAVVEPRDRDEISRIMQVMHGRPEPLRVIGGGSNVLFDSAGFDGVILLIESQLADMRIDGDRVWAQSGISVPRIARAVGAAGLTGIEHTVGIPGTLGGLVLMNGGSQRKGIGSHVEKVVCVAYDGEILELDQDECRFAYRSSRLQTLDAVVVEVTLRLERGDPEAIGAEMDAIVASRAARFPEDLPSCGSTFLSDPAMYAAVGAPGHAIEAAGLKGVRRGDAQISPQHANFFVNLGEASSDDVLYLIALARNAVREQTGYTMDCEVRHIDPHGLVRPAHEAAVERWGESLTAASVD